MFTCNMIGLTLPPPHTHTCTNTHTCTPYMYLHAQHSVLKGRQLSDQVKGNPSPMLQCHLPAGHLHVKGSRKEASLARAEAADGRASLALMAAMPSNAAIQLEEGKEGRASKTELSLTHIHTYTHTHTQTYMYIFTCLYISAYAYRP